MEFKSLCIFLVSGKTITFKDVYIHSDNEYAISFDYTAMSDGNLKSGTFYKQHVAGISQMQ